ncbi:hypothetical protein GGF50DRAFT_68558 [Schizophyllum commune]
MTTPGEQQFYVVALVDALMRELPPNWVVGLLYDIACQIHLSAAKYGLFGGYLDRLRFAVSVFHAFGHDWPCQLVYHPRKCIGFGLTDGEGCERFWYSISKLIPYLRVAGFHLRKYTLNAQFAFATKDAISALASWIGRKARILENKRREALMLLDEAGDPLAPDTDRLLEQGKDLGHRELSKALELHEELERAAAEEAELREEAPEGLEEQAELRAAEAAHLAVKAKYERKLAQLGVPARAQLKKLVGNKLLHRRANALVLLRRVQTGIMKRKLEVERVVRSHRNKNGENRLRKHIKTAAERREGTVKSLVSKYNRACNDLAKLIKAQRSRKGRCPVRPLKLLPKAGLWDLDIDNPCWDDLRFDAAEDSVPPWMSDDNVRKAIRGRLLLDRCAEEEMRLAHERAGLERWFEEEWRVSQSAIARGIRTANALPDAPALIHQLQHRRRGLLRLAIQWQGHGIRIRGPSPDKLTAASRDWAAASCDQPLRFTRADPFDDGVDTRTTRSGAAFSNIVALPDHVDLEELFENAERCRAEEADAGADDASVLTSLPSTRASSPLPELTDEEDLARCEDVRCEAPQAHTSAGKNSKARKSQAHRKRKREEAGNASESSKRHRADKILDAFVEQCAYDFAGAPVTSTGFTCLRNAWEADIPELRDLVGYRLLDWDGRSSGAVTVNPEQIVMVALVGVGKGKDGHLKVADAIKAARSRVTFSEEERIHRRGDFGVKAIGISHGGGQKEPGLLKHTDKTQRELVRITKLKEVQDIAHLNSKAFGNWQPDIHAEYASTQNKLLKWKPRMRRFLNFKKSVWSCLTINFGPRTQCLAHRDFNNLSYGFCAITALGRFNPDKGGHIILRELKLVIRFPPGSSIIIPSALITHHNTCIGEGETRYSITQYTSGAIFRFVEHGLMLDEQYYASLSAAARREAAKANATRWKKGLAKLSRLPALRRTAEKVKGLGSQGIIS